MARIKGALMTRKRNLRKTAVADVTNQKQCKRLVPYK